jgi:tetratricopeptide (TPR) repeat protein
MGARGNSGRIFLAGLALCAAFAAPGLPVRAEDSGVLVLSDRLPSFEVSCPLTGEELRPSEVLAGKPTLLFFTDHPSGVKGDLARFLAELQTEYAPWLSWVGILVGPATSEDIRKLQSSSAVRFSRCMNDRSGEWKAAFGLDSLPAAVFVNADGYVIRRQYGIRADDMPGIIRDVARLVSAGKLTGKPAYDFKLREIETGAERTLADLVGREYTLFLSLRSDCTSCLEELQALKQFRDRNRDRVSLVVVYHDQLQEPKPASGGGRTDGSPDYELWDQGLGYADRYSVSGVPFLLVADRRGTVALARTGFDPAAASSVEEELDRLVSRLPAGARDQAAFLEYLRIREEARAFLRDGNAAMAVFFLERALELNPEYFTLHSLLADAYLGCGKRREAVEAYTRYLAADPQACDRDMIERRIGALTAAQ